MNGTPRLRSAFPSTPQTKPASTRQDASAEKATGFYASPRLPDIGSLLPSKPEPNAPLIPFDYLDAPSQRRTVVSIYLVLWLWRLYDYYTLNIGETESLWLFMKWFAIDFSSLYMLEFMRIPWLEFRPTTQFVVFAFHIFIDALLMFRIPLPFSSLLAAMVRVMYDKELAVSEHYVKPANVIHNPSLILGRQIIHVLPEGTAILNPGNLPHCISPKLSSSSISLPLLINQTNPISLEYVRFDLEKPENETITLSSSQLKRLRKEAVKGRSLTPSDPVTLNLPIKKTGLYRLIKLTDETKLEVQGSSEALVVACPSARMKYPSSDRCIGDLSDLSIEVEGTPPLKVKYRRIENGKDQDVSYQSIQPEDFVSPLMRQQNLGILTSRNSFDLAWARSHLIKVPLNESLMAGGERAYSIEEIVDGSDNRVSYAADDESDMPVSKNPDSEVVLHVHERPSAVLLGHDLQKPMMVADGAVVDFPLHITSTGKGPIEQADHNLRYLFTPENELSANGEHSPNAKPEDLKLKHPGQKPRIREPGLYTLMSVSTKFCSGSILEPRSFMLINAPKPELSISTEQISDKCAGNPIGYRVELDLVGTPPFSIQYIIKGPHGQEVKHAQIHGLRDHIEFRPREAGHYTYDFLEISDSVYKGSSLKHKNLHLEQDVKPSVSAHFVEKSPQRNSCIDQSTQFDIRFQGQGPWALEYELVHGGKRSKRKIPNIETNQFKIDTGPLASGGEHSLVLTSVTDSLGCKEALQQDAKINVRHQRPKASFGSVEGKHTIRTLEGKNIDIPLRLSGESPWYVDYEHIIGDTVVPYRKTFYRANDFIPTRGERGKYKITAVSDSICPGAVENSGDFEIVWIPRPVVNAMSSSLMESINGSEVRKPVCEGEEDAIDIILTGRAPYELEYKTYITLDSGAKSTKKDSEMNVPLNSAQVKMDTSRPGLYEYVFSKLGDYNYDHDAKKHEPLTIRQRVHPRPSVTFANPGKVYSFCQSQDDDPSLATYDNMDSVPITLIGEPPFTVDLELKRSGRSSMRAEALTFSNIADKKYNIHIPPRYLQPGDSALSIRRVRDGRGCERLYDPSLSPAASSSSSSSSSGAIAAPPRVQVSVHDLPRITSLEDRMHYCVGERIAFSLAGGSPPYSITYTFDGKENRANEGSTEFRRIAEAPGELIITAITDGRSTCKRSLSDPSYPAAAGMKKVIHSLPSARISNGKESRVDIHAGGEAAIHFEFGGVPPFEVTYIRSETSGGKGSTGKIGQILETKTFVSEEHSFKIYARDEGAYEIVAIRDRYCSFAREGYAAGGRKLLKER